MMKFRLKIKTGDDPDLTNDLTSGIAFDAAVVKEDDKDGWQSYLCTITGEPYGSPFGPDVMNMHQVEESLVRILQPMLDDKTIEDWSGDWL